MVAVTITSEAGIDYVWSQHTYFGGTTDALEEHWGTARIGEFLRKSTYRWAEIIVTPRHDLAVNASRNLLTSLQFIDLLDTVVVTMTMTPTRNSRVDMLVLMDHLIVGNATLRGRIAGWNIDSELLQLRRATDMERYLLEDMVLASRAPLRLC